MFVFKKDWIVLQEQVNRTDNRMYKLMEDHRKDLEKLRIQICDLETKTIIWFPEDTSASTATALQSCKKLSIDIVVEHILKHLKLNWNSGYLGKKKAPK